MAADLYRVVYDRIATGDTIASEPITYDEAMRRFADCVTLGMSRVRVIAERDYQPALFGPQQQPGVYRGEA